MKLEPRRTDNAVPVLTLQPDASLTQLEATTDAPAVRDTDIPPGSRWMFAKRPARSPIRPAARTKPMLPPVSLIQFAIGSKVAPRYKDTVLITERFRARASGNLIYALTGNRQTKLADMEPQTERSCSDSWGKTRPERRERPPARHILPLRRRRSALSPLCLAGYKPSTTRNSAPSLALPALPSL